MSAVIISATKSKNCFSSGEIKYITGAGGDSAGTIDNGDIVSMVIKKV